MLLHPMGVCSCICAFIIKKCEFQKWELDGENTGRGGGKGTYKQFWQGEMQKTSPMRIFYRVGYLLLQNTYPLDKLN